MMKPMDTETARPAADEELALTAEQLEKWSSELQTFFSRTRERLQRCAPAGCRPSPLPNDSGSGLLDEIRIAPVTDAEADNPAHGPDRGADPVPTGFSPQPGAAASQDPLSRLQEIKRRLAVRLQSS